MQQIWKYRLIHIGKYFAFQDPIRWSILRSGYIHYTVSLDGNNLFHIGKYFVFQDQTRCSILRSGYIQYRWMGTGCSVLRTDNISEQEQVVSY